MPYIWYGMIFLCVNSDYVLFSYSILQTDYMSIYYIYSIWPYRELSFDDLTSIHIFVEEKNIPSQQTLQLFLQKKLMSWQLCSYQWVMMSRFSCCQLLNFISHSHMNIKQEKKKLITENSRTKKKTSNTTITVWYPLKGILKPMQRSSSVYSIVL